ALDAAQRALSLAQESENGLDVGGAWRALGRAVAKIRHQNVGPLALNGSSGGPLPDPVACFTESLRVFTDMNAEAEHGARLGVWARFEVEQGGTEAGERKEEAAQNIFQRLEMPLAVERTDTWL